MSDEMHDGEHERGQRQTAVNHPFHSRDRISLAKHGVQFEQQNDNRRDQEHHIAQADRLQTVLGTTEPTVS